MTKYLLPLVLLLVVSCSQEPQTPDELTAAGERAFGAGDYFQARDYLGRAVLQKPSDRNLLYLLGAAYLRERMYDSAITFLKRADILYPKDREINIALADACTETEQWADARRALEVLVAAGETGADYMEELLRVSLKGQEYPFAYYYARRLLEQFPDEQQRYLAVANLAAELDSLTVAINVMDSALERFGTTMEFINNKATYLVAKRKYAEAERLYRSLVAMDLTSVEYKLNLANALDSQDDRSKRNEAYRILSKLDSTYKGTPRLDSMLTELREELGITAPE